MNLFCEAHLIKIYFTLQSFVGLPYLKHVEYSINVRTIIKVYGEVGDIIIITSSLIYDLGISLFYLFIDSKWSNYKRWSWSWNNGDDLKWKWANMKYNETIRLREEMSLSLIKGITLYTDGMVVCHFLFHDLKTPSCGLCFLPTPSFILTPLLIRKYSIKWRLFVMVWCWEYSTFALLPDIYYIRFLEISCYSYYLSRKYYHRALRFFTLFSQ